MPKFDTPEPIVAVIEVPAGHIVIHAGERADTVVEVRPTDESEDADLKVAEQARVEFEGGQLSVRAPRSRLRSLVGRLPSVDVTIELPAGSRVDAKSWGHFRGEGRIGDATFETAAGSIRLAQAGRLKLRTSAGDISVGLASGHADLGTSSGKIRIGTVDGTAVAKTSNGDITIGEVTGDARLKSANGDITVERALGSLEATTAFGNVRIGEVVRSWAHIGTRFGELEIGIAEGTAAWLDVNSQHGMVRSDLDAVDGPGESTETVEVRARTGYGDILIRRP
jgi:hypothetical protein